MFIEFELWWEIIHEKGPRGYKHTHKQIANFLCGALGDAKIRVTFPGMKRSRVGALKLRDFIY